MSYQIHHGCSKEVLKELIEKGIQVDSIVTDPPYELGFMGKAWDNTGIANDVELWKLALQVLKPGGHLLAFSGSRTYHRMACAIEDAGFEIRDQIMWVYGSGFPKSLNISKALDKMAGAEGEKEWYDRYKDGGTRQTQEVASQSISLADGRNGNYKSKPATDLAKQWDGWGSALKPAHEPIVMARKPLSEKNTASNVIKHGTGAINIDGCRVDFASKEDFEAQNRPNSIGKVFNSHQCDEAFLKDFNSKMQCQKMNNPQGRFPANLIHDGSEEVEAEFGKYGERASGARKKDYDMKGHILAGFSGLKTSNSRCEASTGTASRFFYCAKASKADRQGSKHPTVKPIALMKYLCKLVTPPGGTVLDPFAGTGTTGQAALEQDFEVILIEKEAEYVEDIKKRLESVPLTFWQMEKLTGQKAILEV